MRKSATVFLMALLLAIAGTVKAEIALDEDHQKRMALTNLLSMPLAFTENQGQFGEKTLFMANAGGATFYFGDNEVAYLFVRDTDELIENRGPNELNMAGMPNEMDGPRYKKESMLIKAQFVDANPDPEIIGIDRLSYNSNYIRGNDPSNWRTDVPNYSAIVYKNIYPGIDLKYYGDGRSMKYDFIVNPGADVSRIRIRYDGADDLSVTPAGDLQVQTRFGLIHEKAPYVYQKIGSTDYKVAGGYKILEPGVFGFAMGNDFNPRYSLIIDPELTYSTYLGGNSHDVGYALALDGSGNAYVTGFTWSSDFPTVNPYDGSHNGIRDIFVTKISAAGNSLVYSTYLGGINDDYGYDIAVDASGHAYVTGYTLSADFPTFNAYDASQNGGMDIIVTKLSTAGDSLAYSTFLGGTDHDLGYGIAVDDSANAYVTGETFSSDFPTANAYDGSFNGGNRDAFVTKFSAAGDSLIYSTYLGGTDDDLGNGITVDEPGNSYVTGETESTDFPTVNPYDGSQNGWNDVFVTKFTVGGDSLVYSTYIGGSVADWGTGIAVDNAGNAYVTGATQSLNFPTVNPYDGSHNGSNDVIVTKLSAAGNSLAFSTYLGGSDVDIGYAIAVDTMGNACVAGKTESSDFPMVNPYDGSQNGYFDVFVTRFFAAGDSLDFSTYLGGYFDDVGSGIALDDSGNVLVAGETWSFDFPVANAYDDSLNGNVDVFVTKFGPSIESIPTLSEWGMLIMGLLLLAAGTIAIIKRKLATANNPR